jgi:peptide/nickel transport system permease protein
MRARFRASKLALGFLVGAALASLAAGWAAPYRPEEERREHSFHPPTRIHFRDEAGPFHWKPFVYATRARFDENYRRFYEEDVSEKYFLRFGDRRLFGVEPPGRIYLLGADSRGRDLLSRILYGTRMSFGIGLAGVFVALGIGLLVGGVAGYRGGRWDTVLMRAAEFVMMFPSLYVLLALRSALPPKLASTQVAVLVVILLGALGWGSLARVIRGMVLSIRERDFVTVAKLLGRGDMEILARHVLPHTASFIAVAASVSIPGYILAESALSVLGLGIQEPAVSLGSLLSEALSIPNLYFHPWVLWPGVMLFLVSLSFHAVGDALHRGKEYA